MVKLRLKRMGQKFNAFYRIVAADARAPRDGRFIEEIGYYNPHSKQLFINEEIKDKWIKEGAVPSETVKSLFKKYSVAKKDEKGLTTLSTKPKKPKKKKVSIKAETPKEEAPKEEAPKEEAPKEEAPKEEAPKEEAPKEEAPKEETPKPEESK